MNRADLADLAAFVAVSDKLHIRQLNSADEDAPLYWRGSLAKTVYGRSSSRRAINPMKSCSAISRHAVCA
jgi:hypothetical protein